MKFDPTTQGMGIGLAGIGDPDVVFKRKFRWALQIEGGGDCKFFISPHFVKSASRPNISFEETEVNFLNERAWVPGKPAWEPITVTVLDSNQSGSSYIIQWLSSIFDFDNDESPSKMMSTSRSGYAGKVTLIMYDGCGSPMESWVLEDAWPQAVNFGDLDYSSSDISEVEMTIRYSQVKYKSFCGIDIEKCICESC